MAYTSFIYNPPEGSLDYRIRELLLQGFPAIKPVELDAGMVADCVVALGALLPFFPRRHLLEGQVNAFKSTCQYVSDGTGVFF